MSGELAFRFCIGLTAISVAVWPFIKPRIESLINRPASSGEYPVANDAHTVMSIALRLKAAGKSKSAEIARSLIDSMITE